MIYALASVGAFFFSQCRDSSLPYRVVKIALEVIGIVSLFFWMTSRKTPPTPPVARSEAITAADRTRHRQTVARAEAAEIREQTALALLEEATTTCTGLQGELAAAKEEVTRAAATIEALKSRVPEGHLSLAEQRRLIALARVSHFTPAEKQT